MLFRSKDFEIINLSDNNFENGTTAKLEFEFVNNSLSDEEILMLVGLFDEDEELLINYNYLLEEIKSKDSKILGSGIYIPDDSEYEIRAFIWENFDSQTPILAEPIEIEVED